MSVSDEECPVCNETIRYPTLPSQCCGKVICQRCLSQSLQFRAHCPCCREPMDCAALQNLVPAPVSPSGPSVNVVSDSSSGHDSLNADLEDWSWQSELASMEMNSQNQSPAVRTFVCPYCQEAGLAELELREHCINQHPDENRRVVCPICVAMPHGNPQQQSQNFLRHLDLRHRYHYQEMTNINQTDEMNVQWALLASLTKDS